MTLHYTLLPQRGVVHLTGPDVKSFLQGILTNNLDNLTPDQTLYAALLTPQGRFLFDMILLEQPDGSLLLESERERLPELITTLKRWKLRAKVEMEDVSDHWQVAALFGPDCPNQLQLPNAAGQVHPTSDGFLYMDPRLTDLGARALLPADIAAATLQNLPAQEAAFDAYDHHRIQLAVPDGSRDMPIDKAIILEYGLDRLNGIDFYKGCYLGQELIARTHFRGEVRKHLAPITLSDYTFDPSPEPGAAILKDDQKLGRLCSVCGGVGLALLR